MTQKNIIYNAIIILLILVTYIPSINHQFVSDDLPTIVNNAQINSFSYVTDSPHNLMQVFTDFLTFKLFGLNQAAFRGVAIMFHIGVSILLFMVLSNLFKPPIPFLITSVFSVHPILTEPVIWISAKGYVMLTFFFWLSFYLYISSNRKKINYYFSLVFFIIALLSSEKAFVLALLFPVYEYAYGNLSRNYKKTLVYIFISGVYSLFIIGVLNYAHQRLSFLKNDNSAGNGFYNPFIQIPTAITTYLYLIFWPQILSFYHSDFGLSWTNYIIRLILTIIFIVFYVYSFFRLKKLFFFISVFFIGLLPTLSPLQIAWVVAERYAYFSTIGIIAGFFYIISKFYKNKIFRAAGLILYLLIVGALITRSLIRSADWQNADTLWLATGKTAPSDPKTHINLGDYYGRHGNLDKAKAEFETAIYLKNDYAEAYHNLGNVLYQQKLYDQAEKNYLTTLKINPDIWHTYTALADIYFRKGQFEKSINYLEKVLRLMPNSPDIYLSLGQVYLKIQNRQKAQVMFKKALFIDPDNAIAKNQLLNIR